MGQRFVLNPGCKTKTEYLNRLVRYVTDGTVEAVSHGTINYLH
jgi:hypothetical protein